MTPIGVDKEAESHDLTLTMIGPDGRPSANGKVWLTAIDGFGSEDLTDSDGVIEVRRPKGRYFLEASIRVPGAGEDLTEYLLIQPVVTLDKDTAITVDARTARPFDITVPRPGARTTIVAAGLDLRVEGADIGTSHAAPDLGHLYTAPLGEPLPADQVIASVSSEWADPGPDGQFVNTPYRYGLVDTKAGSMFAGFTRRVRDKDLAAVTSTINAQVPGRRASRPIFGRAPRSSVSWSVGLWFDLPARVTQFLEARGTRWSAELAEFVPDEEGSERYLTSPLGAERTYDGGRPYRDRWNAAVIGPASGYGARFEDHIQVFVPLYSDQDGHTGFSDTDTASTRLYRNGTLIDETANAVEAGADGVPAEKGDFRLVSAATRSVSGLSTRTEVTWTFTSQLPAVEEAVLPLWAVRYLPPVDAHNSVRRKPVSVLPVRFEAPAGAPVGTLRTVEVRVSGDDGAHWRRAELRRTRAGRYLAVFRTPSGAAVSLRAKVADTEGNTVDLTVLRAYALR